MHDNVAGGPAISSLPSDLLPLTTHAASEPARAR
jgi:hypothetical protein